METAIVVILAVVVAAGVGYYLVKVKAPQANARRRAENKVKMSDPILRADIEVLERADSDLLNDAIALRRAQIEQGRDPDYQSRPRRPRRRRR